MGFKLKSMETTPYEMVIRNCAIFLRKQNTDNIDSLTAFELSYGISIGFCKDITEVVNDIVKTKI
jgi:hypothetical protein